MSTVVLPLDIDHTCAEKGPVVFDGPRGDLGLYEGAAHGTGTRPNQCPACCYVRGRLDERGYLDARPWLKKAKEHE